MTPARSLKTTLTNLLLSLPRGIRSGLLLVAIICITAASVDGAVGVVQPGTGASHWPLRVALAVIGGVLLLLVATLSLLLPDRALWHSEGTREKAADDKERWRARPLTDSDIQSIKGTPTARDAERVKNYGHLMLGLAGRMSHCSETYSVGLEDTTRTIEADYQIDDRLLDWLVPNAPSDNAAFAEGVSTPFPVLTLVRGELPDRLSVTMEGKRLAITPYREVLRLQLFTLGSLFDAVFGSRPSPELLKRAERVLVWQGVPISQAEGNVPEDGEEEPEGDDHEDEKEKRERISHWSDVDDLLKDIERAAAGLSSSQGLEVGALIDFLRTYSTAYPVCIELPPAAIKDVISLTIEMCVSRTEVMDGFRDRVRLWLDIKPYKFRVSLSRMFISQSYHLSIIGHPSLYLFSHHLLTPAVRSGEGHGKTASPRLWRMRLRTLHAHTTKNSPESHLRVRSWNSRPVSSLYARGFRSADRIPVYAVARFHERPPGPLGTAASMMALNVILFLIFGYFASLGQFPSSLNLSAFLLALPALALVYFGRGKTEDHSTYSSLTARVGSGSAMALSTLGVLLYALEQTNIFRPSVRNLSVVGLALPFDDAWLALLGVSAFLASYLLALTLTRTWEYHRRLSRPAAQSDEIITARLLARASAQDGP